MYLTSKQARANSAALDRTRADRLAGELNAGTYAIDPVVLDYLERIAVKIEASHGTSVELRVMPLGSLGNYQLLALTKILAQLGYNVDYSRSSSNWAECICVSW
jgi:hypothetical protein